MTQPYLACVRQLQSGNWRGFRIDNLGKEHVLPLVGGFEGCQDTCMALAIHYPELVKQPILMMEPLRGKRPTPPGENKEYPVNSGPLLVVITKTANGGWRGNTVDPLTKELHVIPTVAGCDTPARALIQAAGYCSRVLKSKSYSLQIHESIMSPEQSDELVAQTLRTGSYDYSLVPRGLTATVSVNQGS